MDMQLAYFFNIMSTMAMTRVLALAWISMALASTLIAASSAYNEFYDRSGSDANQFIKRDKQIISAMSPEPHRNLFASSLIPAQYGFEKCYSDADCRRSKAKCQKDITVCTNDGNKCQGQCIPPKLSDGSYSCNVNDKGYCLEGMYCLNLSDN